MKHSELRLDTIYSDIDGRPMMVLSLDRMAVPRRNYGTGRIRPIELHDRSFGVVILRHTRLAQEFDLDDLEKTARDLRDALPEKEQMLGGYRVEVCVTRAIARTWEDHLIQLQMQSEREAEVAAREQRTREMRAAHIARIKTLLPDGMRVFNMSDYSGNVTVRLGDFADLLASAAPVEVSEGAQFTPREMSLLAAGFDAAIATMRYEDGSPVDIVAVKNPYRASES